MRYITWLMLAVVCCICPQLIAQMAVPPEPVEIGTTPQLLLDAYIVDNTWTMKYKTQHIDRVFHAPRKHADNPLVRLDGGYVCIARDRRTGGFHMWYQTHVMKEGERGAQYAIAYAASADGLRWQLPKLGLHEWQGTKENNVVIRGSRGRASSPWLLDVPASEKHGYEYVLSYHDADGTHLVGTHDGIHFDPAGDRRIQHLHSDTQNAIVFDPHRRQYVMYCRAKAVYRAFGKEMIDTGESRRIARIANPVLWGDWPRDAQNILLPDELDTRHQYHAFYGMPTTVYAGVFFGFVWPFRWNDRIHTELAWSRDGIHFERHPLRPPLVDYGSEGSWEDEMVFASSWVEVGDEWWIYYAGWDGPHNVRDRNSGIGLATLRKEGFVSLRGPADGGVVCTRVIRWPGGQLRVNSAAANGRLTVRVSGPDRKAISGFDHRDCRVFSGDDTSATITWNGRSMAELAGQPIRLEFFLQDADLFSFRADRD